MKRLGPCIIFASFRHSFPQCGTYGAPRGSPRTISAALSFSGVRLVFRFRGRAKGAAPYQNPPILCKGRHPPAPGTGAFCTPKTATHVPRRRRVDKRKHWLWRLMHSSKTAGPKLHGTPGTAVLDARAGKLSAGALCGCEGKLKRLCAKIAFQGQWFLGASAPKAGGFSYTGTAPEYQLDRHAAQVRSASRKSSVACRSQTGFSKPVWPVSLLLCPAHADAEYPRISSLHFPGRARAASPAPEFTVSAFAFQFRQLPVQHQAVLSFQTPHETRRRYFGRHPNQHMIAMGNPLKSSPDFSRLALCMNLFTNPHIP